MSMPTPASASFTAAVAAGFSDPVQDAQTVFRHVMTALSEPCRARALPPSVLIEAPGPLGPVAAAIALALFDFESPIFLDAPLQANREVAAFLSFHTGAPIVKAPDAAHFGLISEVQHCPPLRCFAQGLPEYPDRSTTLIVQVAGFESGADVANYTGPGLKEPQPFDVAPAMKDFDAQWQANGGQFPLGVDLLFASEKALAGLPRTARRHNA